MLTGIALSGLLASLYAHSDLTWALAFIAWVPWLIQLHTLGSWRRVLLSGWLMTVVYTAGVFAWFGLAVGDYTETGPVWGLLALLVGAPLFQPQILAMALTQHVIKQKLGTGWAAIAGPAAWVATEALIPKMLGDTWSHGLYPSSFLRQSADLYGTAGLTFMALLSNAGLAWAWSRRGQTWAAQRRPLLMTALPPIFLAAYGLWWSLPAVDNSTATPLKVGMVQANLIHYEQMRKELGAYQAVRQVLDTHYAMSYDAVVNQKADVVLWSETTYPTTLGHPKSPTGAELDQELLGVVKAAGVPFVIGTYDSDEQGEYNAAAFIEPKAGILGRYRKTRLFPLTEFVPSGLDTPTFKSWFPWVGSWRPGDGARVYPLRLADGREIPVMPLICLDDVDTRLGIDGARLGAQAILTLSNDSWFTDYPQGIRLHHAVAAFRSIETRLPQFRLTTNGFSALIAPSGAVISGSSIGQPTLIMGDVMLRPAEPTVLVRWGNWFGLACLLFLGVLACVSLLPSWMKQTPSHPHAAMIFPARAAVMPPAARILAGTLYASARVGLLALGLMLLWQDAWRTQTLLQIKLFVGMVLVPEIAAWLVKRAFMVELDLQGQHLVCQQGAQTTRLALNELKQVRLWRLPLPGAGVHIYAHDQTRPALSLQSDQAASLVLTLQTSGEQRLSGTDLGRNWLTYVQARAAMPRRWIDMPGVKFGLLPGVLALPAFRMHQYIAYGSAVGEWQTFGGKAYLTTLLIWWAAWTIGVTLCAAVVRTTIEAGTLASVAIRPQRAALVRLWLERLGLGVMYLGLPIWLLSRMIGS